MTTRNQIFRTKLAPLATFAAIAFTSVAPVAVAADSSAGYYVEQVSFADLDLRQARDQRTLKSRVRAAVQKVCFRMGDTRSVGLSMQSTCVGETMRQTKPQLIAAIDDARAGREQLASSVVITPSASRR